MMSKPPQKSRATLEPSHGLGDTDAAPYVAQSAATDPAVIRLLGETDPARLAVLEHGLPPAPSVPMPTEPEAKFAILARNIRRRMKSLNVTARAVSVRGDLNAEAVRQILNGKAGYPRQDTLSKIAAALYCHADDLNGNNMLPPQTFTSASARGEAVLLLGRMFMEAKRLRHQAGEEGNARTAAQLMAAANAIDFEDGPYEWQSTTRRQPRHTTEESLPPLPATVAVPTTLSHRRDLPIYAAAQGGEDGSMILEWNPIDHIARPDSLAHSNDAFGFYVVETSMSPVYEHGDMVIVKPGLPPKAGANAVFIKQTEDGATYALVKRLESWTAREWRVTQYHPKKKTFTLDRKQWAKCLVIVMKQER